MYLARFDLTVYDRNGNILITGYWKSSFWHGYPDAGEVVDKVVQEMFTHFPNRSQIEKSTSLK